MRYYVTTDVHGFYSAFRQALDSAGYFHDPQPHRLIILGDLFDRGSEAPEMQRFILRLMDQDAPILIRGNHEDLFVHMVTADRGLPVQPHLSNGTYSTALQLTGFDYHDALRHNIRFAAAARETPFYRQIIPYTIDYYETEHYIFVHGWIPCLEGGSGFNLS